MARASHWELTPQQSIQRECDRRGRDQVINGCVAVLDGNEDGYDATLIVALGGPAAHRVLSGEYHGDGSMWLRVWALRGLLWEWSDRASPALGRALTDPAWRVREMAARVARRHRVGEHIATVAVLRDDPVPRVRSVAIDAERQIAAEEA